MMLTYNPLFTGKSKDEIIEKNRNCDVDFDFSNKAKFGKVLNIRRDTVDL